MDNRLTVTVSQVNRHVSLMLKGDKSLGDIYVKGEISNFNRHYKSGHIYFTLKDGESAIKCVMFSSNAANLCCNPENGMLAVVRGSVQVFERDGLYQLYAAEIEPDGLGDLHIKFEQLKRKLELEGLFTKKRPIPSMPRKIALVTAKGGAALQDILSVIERRYPIVRLILIPVLVQGENAEQSIASGISSAQKTDADLIIFGRGGGSIEDLWAFNSETVARAVYNSNIPTISAVGHETDFTISDFVADLRAPTPSAAAELAVPDINNIKLSLMEFGNALKADLTARIGRYALVLDAKRHEIESKSPRYKLDTAYAALKACGESISFRTKSLYERKESGFIKTAELINSLNPFNVMLRGYSMVYKNNMLVRESSELKTGDVINIKMQDGQFSACVTEKG